MLIVKCKSSVTGYVTLLTSQVLCAEFSKCYSDVNICLWTDGSMLSQSDARQACQQRNNAFLVRVTDNSVQSKLSDFRSATGNLLGGSGIWIDVYAVAVSSSFYWIDDGSPLAGLYKLIRCDTLLYRIQLELVTRKSS